MRNYVCYDGVEGDYTFHDTEEDAVANLKRLVSESLDCDEWMEGVERGFVAKVTHTVEQVKRELDEEEREIYDEDYVDMIVTEKGAL